MKINFKANIIPHTKMCRPLFLAPSDIQYIRLASLVSVPLKTHMK